MGFDNFTDDYNTTGASAYYVLVMGITLQFSAVILWIACILGLIGNSLVIFVILRNSKMQTVTNIYILNLAIADFVFMVVEILLGSDYYNLRVWSYGIEMCRIMLYVDRLNQFVSIYLLMVMSVDRYLAVVHAIKSSQFRTCTIAAITSAMVWLISMFIAIPAAVNSMLVGQRPDHMACHSDPKIWELWVNIIACYFIPLVVIVTCYALMIIRLRSVKPKGLKPERRKKSTRKVTRLVISVVAAFIICWTPFYLVLTVRLCIQMYSLPLEILGTLTIPLAAFNSCLNPFLYAFLSDNFRKAFFRVFRCTSAFDRSMSHSGAAGARSQGTNANTRVEAAKRNAARTDTVNACDANNAFKMKRLRSDSVNVNGPMTSLTTCSPKSSSDEDK